MKKSKLLLIIIFALLIVGLAAGCTRGGAASSWPGISLRDETGYLSYGSQVYAIDTGNGNLIWRYPQDPNNTIQFYASPEIGNEMVVVGSYANNLVGLDRESGFKEWEFAAADDRFVGSALIVNGSVFAPNADGYLYALNESGDLQWRFKSNGPNWTKPTADDLIYFASMDHSLYALNPDYDPNDLEMDKDGSRTLVSDPVWSVDLGAAVTADPLLVGEQIFVATVAGNFYAVDSGNGQILWIFNDAENLSAVWGPPVFFDGNVYFGDVEGKLYCLDAESGEMIWSSHYDAGSRLIAGGVSTESGVVFVTEGGRVFIINENQYPDPVASFEASLYSDPKYTEDTIIIAPASQDALLTAVDLDGNEIWSFAPSE